MKSTTMLLPLALTAILVMCSTVAMGQQTIQVISPAANTTVAPGQSFTVTVTKSSDIVNVALAGSLIAGSDLIPILSGPNPLVFTVTVPSNKPAGSYIIAAIDATPHLTLGAGVMSSPLPIIVEPQSQVISISSFPPSIAFGFPGDARNLRAFAHLSDGTNPNITSSTKLIVQSSNPNVVSISGRNRLIATGPGTAAITLLYQNSYKASVSISVPTSIPGDLNGDGKVDIYDLNILNSSLNSKANGINDARDLNHDGKIDALDARILTTLCAFPRCASHP